MKDKFWRDGALVVAQLVVLIAFGKFVAAHPPEGLPENVTRALRSLRSGELNKEAREGQVAGYYEDLIDEGSRATGVQSFLIGGMQEEQPKTDDVKWEGNSTSKGDRYEKVDGFLLYVQKPNVNVPDAVGFKSRHITNSMGLSDREYSLAKAPGTRRIAVLGDSVTRGFGAALGTTYDALFENSLNEQHLGQGVDRFEVLNFAVGGYRITQILDVGLETAPKFKPDVYVIALTEQTNSERWGAHLAQLYRDGIDLKYARLKELVKDAGLKREEPMSTMVSKLARFRLDTIGWVLREVRSAALRDQAQLVVLLVPTVRERLALEDSFSGMRELLGKEGIAYVDLLDSFDDIEDLSSYKPKAGDVHPNERGHRLIFDSLNKKIAARPELSTLFHGRASN